MIDLQYLRSISDNNTEFINQMIQTFLDHAPTYVSEIEAACENKRWADLREAAHKLKPSASYMGITKLLEVILALESLVNAPLDNSTEINNCVQELAGLCNKAYPLLQNQMD